jgi:protein phosphatase methylesterase 1
MTSRPPVGEDNLRSSLLKSRIAKLPHLPAIAPSQWSSKSSEEKEEDGLGDLSMAPPPRSAFQRSAESKSLDHHYTPLSARDCFQEALEVDIDHIEGGEVGKVRVAETENHEASSSSLGSSQASSRATFRVYYTPPIHKTLRKGTKEGSAKNLDLNSLPSLDSLDAAPEVEESDSNSKTIFLFHHGAGYSALSYALVAKHITEISKGEAGVLAFDCRGHGMFSLLVIWNVCNHS